LILNNPQQSVEKQALYFSNPLVSFKWDHPEELKTVAAGSFNCLLNKTCKKIIKNCNIYNSYIYTFDIIIKYIIIRI